jgi:hypothetical protein
MADGRLHPDPSLIIEPEPTPEELVDDGNEQLADDEFQVEAPSATIQSFSLQIDTPDSASVAAAEAQLRGMFGVRSLNMGSLAIGGTSVYRIGYDGNLDALRTALAARGWQVEITGSGLIIRKARSGQ